MFAVNSGEIVALFGMVLVVSFLLDISAYKNNSQNNRQIDYFHNEVRPAVMVKNHRVLPINLLNGIYRNLSAMQMALTACTALRTKEMTLDYCAL